MGKERKAALGKRHPGKLEGAGGIDQVVSRIGARTVVLGPPCECEVT